MGSEWHRLSFERTPISYISKHILRSLLYIVITLFHLPKSGPLFGDELLEFVLIITVVNKSKYTDYIIF